MFTQAALSLMTRVYICGIHRFATNEEMRLATRSLPCFSHVLPHPIYFHSQMRFGLPDAPESAKWIIPWAVKIILPSKTLQQLDEAKLEALLYCASVEEMSEWIDWFENEDKRNTLTHQLLSVGEYYEERRPFEAKLNELAFPYYEKAAREFFKNDFSKVFKKLEKINFAPKAHSTIADSYILINKSLSEESEFYWKDFQRFWRRSLKKLMFADVKWTQDQQESALAEYFPQESSIQPSSKNPRWKTSLVTDRQTYAKFIQYFADQFLVNISKNKVAGEIVLLLWIMIYIAREPSKTLPVARLLELTTADIDDRILFPGSEEIELSCGLADLIKQFIGSVPQERQQKLFRNLTIDQFEDHCHRASKIILPQGSLAVLPEAFLTFPHAYKNLRMAVEVQRSRPQQYSPVHPDPIPVRDLKKQLFENASQ